MARWNFLQNKSPVFDTFHNFYIRIYTKSQKENCKIEWRHSLVYLFPFMNKALAIAVMSYVKADNKVFLSCLTLLDFFSLVQKYCLALGSKALMISFKVDEGLLKPILKTSRNHDQNCIQNIV